MEYYESKCKACGHTWQWVGYKTGIGKTPAQLEAMSKAGKTCPKCNGEAQVGLDNTSPDAQALNEAYADVVKKLFGV